MLREHRLLQSGIRRPSDYCICRRWLNKVQRFLKAMWMLNQSAVKAAFSKRMLPLSMGLNHLKRDRDLLK